MHNTVPVQVFDRGEHLAHDVGSLVLGELLSSDDAIEKLATAAPLHHDVHVAVIDVALVELDNIGVVDLLQNRKLFLEKTNILGDVFTENRLDGVGDLWVGLEGGRANGAEMTTTDHFNEVVDRTDVRGRKCVADVVKDVLTRFASFCVYHSFKLKN